MHMHVQVEKDMEGKEHPKPNRKTIISHRVSQSSMKHQKLGFSTGGRKATQNNHIAAPAKKETQKQ